MSRPNAYTGSRGLDGFPMEEVELDDQPRFTRDERDPFSDLNRVPSGNSVIGADSIPARDDQSQSSLDSYSFSDTPAASRFNEPLRTLRRLSSNEAMLRSYSQDVLDSTGFDDQSSLFDRDRRPFLARVDTTQSVDDNEAAGLTQNMRGAHPTRDGDTPELLMPQPTRVARVGSQASPTSKRSTSLHSMAASASGSPVRRVSMAFHNLSSRVVKLSHDQPTRTSSAHTRSPAVLHSPLPAHEESLREEWYQWQREQLRGHPLKIFGPNNHLRKYLCNLLLNPMTEPFILALIVCQTVLLAVQALENVYKFRRYDDYGLLVWRWPNWALLVIFIIYTIEIIARSIVSGFFFNPKPIADHEFYSSPFFQSDQKDAMSKRPYVTQTDNVSNGNGHKGLGVFDDPPDHKHLPRRHSTFIEKAPMHIRHFAHVHKADLLRCAFLRHGFSRLDFVSVLSFWIEIFLEKTFPQSTHHIRIFRMMACLRILRLLNITPGTSAILKSLKMAAPALMNVGFFLTFFWVIFSIIGVQSFKSSFRRQCVWVDPTGQEANFTHSDQFCGGQYNDSGRAQPYYYPDGSMAQEAKGFICPTQSKCVEGDNAYNGAYSFDNIGVAMQLVFVIIATNGYSDIMYDAMDADMFSACIFFIGGIIVLTYWLVSLVIAVVTNSFQNIRDESKASAFTGKKTDDATKTSHWSFARSGVGPRMVFLNKWWDRTSFIWPTFIIADIVVNASRSYHKDYQSELNHINIAERVFTILFLFEIIFRFALCFPNWRSFFRTKQNLIDASLAIITTVIQFPPIRSSGTAYRWLTVFQVMRFYRILLWIPFTRDLVLQVMGSALGIVNLVSFLLLTVFLFSIFAVSLFRGEIPDDDGGDQVDFAALWNSYLGMFQIFSSEDWTSVLFPIVSHLTVYNVGWVASIFFISWYAFSNFVLVPLYIAVIQENFDQVRRGREQQLVNYVNSHLDQKRQNKVNAPGIGMIKLAYRSFKSRRIVNEDYDDPQSYNELTRQQVVREFLQSTMHKDENSSEETIKQPPDEGVAKSSVENLLVKVGLKSKTPNSNPFSKDAKRRKKRLSQMNPETMATVAASDEHEHNQRKISFLETHPDYNVALWLFRPENKLRRFCQKFCAPGVGKRLQGNDPVPVLFYPFLALTYGCIIALVVAACITTPLYERTYFDDIGTEKHSVPWFSWVDMGLTVFFTVEAAIKIIADGFWFTPNAYAQNIWNAVDFVILLTLWVNVAADFLSEAGISRAFRGFKALRALRLVAISDRARQTFYDVFIVGAVKILAAGTVAVGFLIPFAIWGQTLFAGKLNGCTDGSVNGVGDCVFEYRATPQNWEIWAPRVWTNENDWSFDNFAASMLIMYESISLEGWIDVMHSLMSITGYDSQPKQDANPQNSIFMVSFILLGALFILSLFIAVIISNYTERRGSAFLTAEQRAWIEARKILEQVNPSRRPNKRHSESWRAWCYDLAVQKHSRWSKTITTLYFIQLIALCVEYYRAPEGYELARNVLFILLAAIFLFDGAVRIIGLSLRYFVRNKWNIFGLFTATGSFGLTIALVIGYQVRLFEVFQKLFLVLTLLNLIPRIDSLERLFKTAIASLPTIGSLLATWAVFYIAFAIGFTQIFGLTRIGSNSTGNLNFRTIFHALVVMFRMSCGEGWNGIMHGYTLQYPKCVQTSNFYTSDCGSRAWAYGLFIAWNVISMYIFVNMFITVVFESFSYVYSLSGNVSLISRDGIRHFKQYWARFDPEGTGFISKSQIPKFLSGLEGPLEVRIYPEPLRVRTILDKCSEGAADDAVTIRLDDQPVNRTVDLDLLNQQTAAIDVRVIRSRRRNYEQLYHEFLKMDNRKGVSISAMLLTLSSQVLVDWRTALTIDEFLRRSFGLYKSKEETQRNIVERSFQTLYYRMQFLNHLREHNPRLYERILSRRHAMLHSPQRSSTFGRSPSPRFTERTSPSIRRYNQEQRTSIAQSPRDTQPPRKQDANFLRIDTQLAEGRSLAPSSTRSPSSPGDLWSNIGSPHSPSRSARVSSEMQDDFFNSMTENLQHFVQGETHRGDADSDAANNTDYENVEMQPSHRDDRSIPEHEFRVSFKDV